MSAERLSADLQFFREGVPTLFVVFAACVLLAVFFAWDGFSGLSLAVAILVPVALAVALVWVRRTVAGLAEEVDVVDDALIVRRRGIEQRIPLVGIVDVRRDLLLQPGITLVLSEPGPFGDRVRFLPANAYFALNWNRNHTARRLDTLIGQARRRLSST
ncbi:MAG: hypothetical protein ACOY82_09290 [Pseudomonadota bacterium]